MAYRDDLEAATLKIEQLEQKVEELEAGVTTAVIVTSLKQRNRDLERLVAELRKEHIAHAPLLLGVIPVAVLITFWLASLYLVVGESEKGAWELMNVTVAVGVVCTAWSWGRVHRLGAWLGVAALKVVALLLWGSDWWSLCQDGVIETESSLGIWDAAFYFYWGAPMVLGAVVIAEAVALYHLHTRARQVHAEAEVGER